MNTFIVLLVIIISMIINHSDATCTIADPTGTDTSNPPTINTGASSYAASILTIVVEIPLVSNRSNYAVTFIGSGANAACNYPGANWNAVFDTTTDCINTFTSTIDWVNFGKDNCAFTPGTSGTDVTYTSYFKVSYTETLPDLRGVPVSRSIETIFSVMLSFPTEIVVDGQITIITASVSMFVELQEESFDPVARKGTLVYVTSVHWPYLLGNASIITAPSGLTPTIKEITGTGDCPAGVDGTNENPPCTQYWEVTLTPTTACTLTGSYTFTFNASCHNTVNCPLTASDKIATFSSSVTSTDFCGILHLNTTITGNLVSYGDDTHISTKRIFVDGQTIYYKASIASNQATISQVTFFQVTVNGKDMCTNNNCVDNIFSNYGLNNGFAFTRNINTAVFQFDVSVGSGGNDLFDLAPDDNQTFTVSALVNVSYADTFGRRSKSEIQRFGLQRASTATKSEALPLASSVVIVSGSNPTNPPGDGNGNGNGNGNGGGSSSSGSSSGALTGAVAGAVVAGVVVGGALFAGARKIKAMKGKVGHFDSTPNTNDITNDMTNEPGFNLNEIIKTANAV